MKGCLNQIKQKPTSDSDTLHGEIFSLNIAHIQGVVSARGL